MFALASGHGGSYTALALPATASRQLLVPAVIALFFAYVARRSWPASRHAGGRRRGALALVHPTYALFVLIPLAGYVVARLVLARTELAEGGLALAAVVVPAGAVALWLRPIARETVSVNPSESELHRALRHYANQLDVFSDGSYRLAPEVVGRAGAVAVLALFARPARRAGGAAPLGCLRDRRLPRRPRPDAVADAVHALLRCRVDLAGAARSGVRPIPVRGRRRRGGARPAARARRAAGRARRRASPSSSPIRAISAMRSTTAARRWRPGWPSSAPPRRWWSERSCRAG